MVETAKLSSITINTTKITYLPDGGGVVEPLALYPGSGQEDWVTYSAFLNDDGKFITSIGAFLIEIGDRKIAVDMGMGPITVDFPGFGPFSGGSYPDSLHSTGLAPDEVTDVVFTHLHLDHVGWTTQEVGGERRLTYPNARYYVSETEWNFWHGGDNPAGPHPEFVQKPLENRVELIHGGDTIVPGVTVVPTPGHTPGHISLLVTEGSERVYLMGDVFNGPMQVEKPDWNVAFDTDAALARRSREELLDELVRPNTIAAAGHFTTKVFGRVVHADGRRRWLALD